ncbi:hypothetical protein [uncultured Arthrobacter sp.]|uniref:hypothetical protein n=1 Tax=uncultured Arthrobacter sp. TaxID=114050 RepID=UPI0028D02DB2|nr:hypothetical protein [uncultured Arthrobacter sp.]
MDKQTTDFRRLYPAWLNASASAGQPSTTTGGWVPVIRPAGPLYPAGSLYEDRSRLVLPVSPPAQPH